MVVGCQPLTGESMRWIKDTVSGLSNPHDAAARNKVSRMRKYLMQGGDVNKLNKLGDTPLHEACAYIRDNGDSSKGRRRKMVGKDRRKVGKKLSNRAPGEGSPSEMLELLIRGGANINAHNIVGDAPLHKAALNGRAVSADYLIQAGANVNIRNEFAQTPLHAACVSGNIEVVQRLVEGGADTSAQDAAEDTPFHEACRHQYEGIVIYMMGLVNKPMTSQGLELWEGMDPGWEKMLRDRAKARVEDAEEREEDLKMAASAQSPSAIAISTPSTAHNSIESSCSATSTSHSRTPSGPTLANQSSASMSISVQSSHTESMSPSRGVITVQAIQEPIAESEPGGITPSDCSVPLLPGGGSHGDGKTSEVADPAHEGQFAHLTKPQESSASIKSISDGVSSSFLALAPRLNRRGRSQKRALKCHGKERTFSTERVEVLAWQATKVKSEQHERVIEQARKALREEQREAAAVQPVVGPGSVTGPGPSSSKAPVGDDDSFSIGTPLLTAPDVPAGIADEIGRRSTSGAGTDDGVAQMDSSSKSDTVVANVPAVVGTATAAETKTAPPTAAVTPTRQHEATGSQDTSHNGLLTDGAVDWAKDRSVPASTVCSTDTTPITNPRNGITKERLSVRLRNLSISRDSGETKRTLGSNPIPPMPTPPPHGPREIRLQSPAREGRRRAVRKGKAVALASPRLREPGSHRRGSHRSSRRDGSGKVGSDRSGSSGIISSSSRASSRSASEAGSGSLGGSRPPTPPTNHRSSSRHHYPQVHTSRSRQRSNSSSQTYPKHSPGACSLDSTSSASQCPSRRGSNPRSVLSDVSAASQPCNQAKEENQVSPSSWSARCGGIQRRDRKLSPTVSGDDGDSRASPTRSSRRPPKRLSGSSSYAQLHSIGGDGKQISKGGNARVGGRRSSGALHTPSHRATASPPAGTGGGSAGDVGGGGGREVSSSIQLGKEYAPARPELEQAAKISPSGSERTRKGTSSAKTSAPAAVSPASTSSRSQEGGGIRFTPKRGRRYNDSEKGTDESTREKPGTVRPSPGRRVLQRLGSGITGNWGSEVSSALAGAIPERRRVVESNLPVKRMSPYKVRPMADGPPATLDVADANSMPSASGGGRQGGREGAVCRASSGGRQFFSSDDGNMPQLRQQRSQEVPSVGDEACRLDRVERCKSWGGIAGQVSSENDSKAIDKGQRARSTTMTSIYESRSSRGARSPPLLDPLYLTGAEDDLPPGMDALGKIVYGTDNGEKGFDGIVDGSDGGGASPEESGASVGDGEGLRDTSALRKNPRRQNSWVISAQHTSSKAVVLALGASKALLFSDSDTDEGIEGGSSSVRRNTKSAAGFAKSATTFGISTASLSPSLPLTKTPAQGSKLARPARKPAEESVAEPTATPAGRTVAPVGTENATNLTRKSTESEDGSTKRATKSTSKRAMNTVDEAWDKEVEATLEAAADGAASSVIRKLSKGELKRPVVHEIISLPSTETGSEESQQRSSRTLLSSAHRDSKGKLDARGVAGKESADNSDAAFNVRVPELGVPVSKPDAIACPTERELPSDQLSPPTSASFMSSSAFFGQGLAPGHMHGQARSRSTLGLLGKGPATKSAKIAIPIAGGRAAWNKFLSNAAATAATVDASSSTTTTPTSDAVDVQQAAEGEDGVGKTRDHDSRASVKPHALEGSERASEDADGGDTTGADDAGSDADNESPDEARGPPRGFKEPVRVDGPNKGPAGAFSGNAMWRLAGGTGMAASRAKSGVAANGHGGYSNPLAVIRTTGATGSSAGATASGAPVGCSDGIVSGLGTGAVMNPLAGLRGTQASSVANPLARSGIGRNSLPGGAGVSNPLLLGGRSSNLLARPRGFVGGGAGTLSNPGTGAVNDGMARLARRATTTSLLEGTRVQKHETAIFSTHDKNDEEEPSREAEQFREKHEVGQDENHGSKTVHEIGMSSAASTVSSNSSIETAVLGALPSRLSVPPLGRRARSVMSQGETMTVEGEKNPGQARVASAVMAMQKSGDDLRGEAGFQDTQHVEVSNVAEQGLVRLRRVKYSPRPV